MAATLPYAGKMRPKNRLHNMHSVGERLLQTQRSPQTSHSHPASVDVALSFALEKSPFQRAQLYEKPYLNTETKKVLKLMMAVCKYSGELYGFVQRTSGVVSIDASCCFLTGRARPLIWTLQSPNKTAESDRPRRKRRLRSLLQWLKGPK